MDANDFRRIALSFEGAEEGSHMGNPDFRVGGRIFATLASADKGYGNLILTPEQRAAFVEELPEVFVPIAGGWGRMGATHIRLAAAQAGSIGRRLTHGMEAAVCEERKVGSRKGAPRQSEPGQRRLARNDDGVD